MPHSSGGGSHSGGSHGGSHGSSSTPVYNHYVPGTHRFVYYKNGRPNYYYSTKIATDDYATVGKFLNIFGAVWISICLVMLVMTSWKNPQKLNSNTINITSVWDDADVLSTDEEQELTQLLKSFKNDTGISVVIHTIHENEWSSHFYSLENYTYDEYLNIFNDETCWLLVYATDEGEEFEDWEFEGMQGNDTNYILSTNRTHEFNYDLNKYLTARTKYTVGESFIKSLKTLSDGLMDAGIDGHNLMYSLIFLVFGMLIMGFIKLVAYIARDKDAPLKAKAVQCADATSPLLEDTCDYCNGIYIHGIHTSCPHCGAPIRKMQAAMDVN